MSEFHQFYVSIQEAQLIFANTPKFKQDPDPDMMSTPWPEEVMMPAEELTVDGDTNNDCTSTQVNINPLDGLDLEMATYLHVGTDSKPEIKLERLTPDEFMNQLDDVDIIVTRSGRKRRRDTEAIDKERRAKEKRSAQSKGHEKRKTTAKRTFKKQQWPPFCKEDEDLIKRYIVMGCELCIFLADDFDGIRDHFKEKHPDERPYVKCCGRKLNKRCLIVEHARRHENPEYIK